MPSFRATLVNKKTGAKHFEKVTATDQQDVLKKVDVSTYSVFAIDDLGAEAPGVGRVDGSGYGTAAAVAGLISLVCAPMCVAAMILGGAAYEKSRGKSGGAGIALAALSAIGWTAAILVGYLTRSK